MSLVGVSECCKNKIDDWTLVMGFSVEGSKDGGKTGVTKE